LKIPRFLDISAILAKKSLLLLGPRQTGKSWWIRNSLSEGRVYNLLKHEDYTRLARNPGLIREELTGSEKYLVIDEVQKLPQLMDEAQVIIEEWGIPCLLTGSSARRLKARNVNLLGGRARLRSFHPFSWVELKEHFDLKKALTYGLLPSIYFSDAPQEDLLAYAGTYLREEVAAEGAAKNVPVFSRFLEVAALQQSQLLNYTNVANDSQVPVATVRSYYQILEDTLLGSQLLPFKQTSKRKAISTAKFYFFDIGVARHLQGRAELSRNSADYGEAFESFIHHEIRTYLDYTHPGTTPLTFWRSKSNFEVDFVIGDHTAIEVKATANATDTMLKGLRAFSEDVTLKRKFLVYLGSERRKTSDGITILPFNEFLELLWSGKLV
jgi:uncharacterized protein